LTSAERLGCAALLCRSVPNVSEQGVPPVAEHLPSQHRRRIEGFRHAVTLLGNLGRFGSSATKYRTRPTRPCPLRPDSDHDCTALQYVAKGQKRAHALQQLFDHLVGSLKERFRDRKAECLRGLEVDNQFELGRELDCPMNSSCFAAPNICLTTPVEPTIANRVCPALPSMVLRQSCCWTHSLPNFVSATFVDPRPHSTHDATAGCAGTMKLKIAPCGVLGLAHNRPLCASIIDRQIDSPSPKPSDFVV